MSEFKLRIGDTEFTAEVREITPDTARVVVNGTEYAVDLVEFGRRPVEAAPVSRPAAAAGPVPRPAAAAPPRSSVTGVPGAVAAPLPGLILDVKVKVGDQIQTGQPVVIMEAMKMENIIPAPHNGTVRKVFVSNGDSVGEGDSLVEIALPEMTTL